MGKENLEEWRDIPGYEGLYQISSFGRVRSVDRVLEYSDGRKYYHKGKILKLLVDAYGYYKINLYKEGKQKTKKIHQLVAIAFLGHKPNGYSIVCDHVDNNPLNNRLDNLQLITHRENLSKDRVGSSKFTGVHWCKKLLKWRSNITINGSNIHLGSFHNEERAGQIYQLALSNIDKFNGNPKEFRQYLNCKKNC